MCTGEGVGRTARQCRGSALGKEGRKYGVGMGENCPFMHETTVLKPTMDGVGMGENCHFMHETTALKPTMDGVGMGENCHFMHGKRLLYPTNYWAEVPDTCAVGVGVENLGCAGI